MGQIVSADEGGQVHQPPSDAHPQSPTHVSRPGWRATLKRTLKETKADRIPIIAAGVAFYWFLAIFPLLFAAIGLLQLLSVSPSVVNGIASAIHTALPGSAATILTQALHQATRRAGATGLTALIVGIVLAVWSASSGMAATQVGMNVAYDVPRDRPFIKKRLMAILLIVVALVLGGVAAALLVFGQPLGVWVQKHVPDGSYFVWAWTVVRWILTVLAIVSLFAVFYYLGPNRKAPAWAWLSPGGVVAAVIWIVVSLGFSFYVSNFGGSYARTYGALMGVVILMLWLYLTSLALLLGAELNGELERQRAIEADARQEPRSERPPAPSPDAVRAG